MSEGWRPCEWDQCLMKETTEGALVLPESQKMGPHQTPNLLES